MLSYGLSVWAMAHAPISLVAALRETSVIFGMLLAVFYLKERFTLFRALSVFFVVAGAISSSCSRRPERARALPSSERGARPVNSGPSVRKGKGIAAPCPENRQSARSGRGAASAR